MSHVHRIYETTPPWVQDAAVSLAGFQTLRARYGGSFDEILRGYQERDHWSPDKVFEFRRARRAIALEQAARTPHYHRIFREMDGEWWEFVEPANFRLLPITTKKQVLENLAAFQPRPRRRNDVIARTSGTTGAALVFPQSKSAVTEQWAVWWRYRGWHGIRRDTWSGFFGGRNVVPMRDGKNRPWRVNFLGKEVRFSVYHIGGADTGAMVREMRKRRLPWIHGYPSALNAIAADLLDRRETLGYRLHSLTTGAENLTVDQTERMTTAFGVRPVQHYGLAEGVANISECPNGRLHIDEDFAETEFVVDNVREGGAARLVGSAFANDAFSLLRYDTGDLVKPGGQCGCYRAGRVIEAVDGRADDVIYLPDGRRVGRISTAFTQVPGLLEAQIVQVSRHSLEIRYVRGADWNSSTIEALQGELVQRLGSEMSFSFREVDRVPRTANGKIRLVVSQL
jgi:phenylacetate-CoA ligase